MYCPDCIHYDVCKNIVDRNYKGDDICNDIESICEHFKDKSKMIDIPCAVGSICYMVKRTCSCGGYETKGEYFPTYSECESCCETCDKQNVVGEIKMWTLDAILKHQGIFGTVIFFTREEAEAKLKETV